MENLKKITWVDLERLQNDPKRYLYRTESVQYVYEKYLEILKKNNISVKEFVIGAFFKKHPAACLKIVKNKFPYYLDDTIEHLIIWPNPNKPPISEEKIKSLLEKKYKNKRYLIFKNISGSIPEIEHYQLFLSPQN